MKTLMDAVRGALETSGAARVLCAVSGGCDSMALLHALYRLRNERPFELMASHVQHGLRGEDSLEDSIKLFEEGAKLSAFCYDKLKKAEQKINTITKKEETSDEE